MTRKGGLPEDPTQGVNRNRVWVDVRSRIDSEIVPALVEATTWYHSANGKIQLVAPSNGAIATCSHS